MHEPIYGLAIPRIGQDPCCGCYDIGKRKDALKLRQEQLKVRHYYVCISVKEQFGLAVLRANISAMCNTPSRQH